jgi:hypothetical protein
MTSAFKRPIVGLFLDKVIVENLKNQRGAFFFRVDLLAEAAETAGVTLVVFSPGDVNFATGRLGGACYNHRARRWEAGSFPLPDVLYDRFVGSGPEQTYRAGAIRSGLQKRGVQKINARHYFDKWEVYQLLSRNKKIEPHLPPTVLLQSAGDLETMFAGSKAIFLKAAAGRRGKQVINATRLPEGGYFYRYFNEKLFSGQVQTLAGLYLIARSIAGKKVIAQQAVDLLKINQRVVDLRGEMQRNGKGELVIVDIPVRLGSAYSPIATHGSSDQFAKFFHRRLGYTPEKVAALRQAIEELLVAVYGCIERAYGPFGEIAIDFGLDNGGKIWFFECNAKSMKVSLCQSAGAKTVKQAFLNPMLYAKYLYSRKSMI